MEALAAIGGITTAGLAITVAVLALRLAGAKKDAVDADQRRHGAEKQLMETAREWKIYRERAEHRMAALVKDIEGLEDDLETCTTPGARRDRLRRLLSKATDRSNGGDPPSLRSERPTEA